MTDKINPSRRKFLTQATTVIGGVGAGFAVVPFLGSWMPSKRAEALGAPVEVNIAKLEAGAQLTVAWRGKPIWIVRRTPKALETLAKTEDLLRDPNSEDNMQPLYAKNKYRSIKPDFLILVGLCTHLGCVPSYRPELGAIDANWLGGFYCPCHGSKYDLAGRVYKGVPAPTNMEVPPHRYLDDGTILVGEHQE